MEAAMLESERQELARTRERFEGEKLTDDATIPELTEEAAHLIRSLIGQGRVAKVAALINGMDPVPCLLFTMAIRVRLSPSELEAFDAALAS